MDIDIIFIYCLCDEILKANHHLDNPQCKMFTSEVMTLCITASLYFGGNYAKTRLFFLSHRYFGFVLSKSRLNKRIHKIPSTIWLQVLMICRTVLQNDKCHDYVVDSFPVITCQTCRSWRCKLFSSKSHHGYSASKKCYFWGIKVHMVVTADGIPVEFIFTPGSVADIKALREFELDLPEGSYIFGDKAYTDYNFEEQLKDFDINLIPERKRNSKRKHNQYLCYIQKNRRKRVETVFSGITRLMPRSIHAITEKGFLLKIMIFIVSYSVSLCNA